MTTGLADPITFAVIKSAFDSIADEMALTIFRTTYSGVLKDNMDYSTAFCDADGKLVAQGLTLPGHLGAIPTALAAVVDRYADDIHYKGGAMLMENLGWAATMFAFSSRPPDPALDHANQAEPGNDEDKAHQELKTRIVEPQEEEQRHRHPGQSPHDATESAVSR